MIPRDQLLHLLQQTFGTKVELIDSRIGNRHHDYLVLLVQLRRPSLDLVVKLAGPEAPLACSFERTAMLHRLVATRTTIPMPEVLAVDTSYRTWPWRIFIKTHIPGLEWAVVQGQMNRDELSGAYRQIGEAVAQLHAIQFPAFGEIAVDGSVPGNLSCLAALTGHANSIIKSARLHELFLSVLEERRHLFLDIKPVSLCHEDLHKYNHAAGGVSNYSSFGILHRRPSADEVGEKIEPVLSWYRIPHRVCHPNGGGRFFTTCRFIFVDQQNV